MHDSQPLADDPEDVGPVPGAAEVRQVPFFFLSYSRGDAGDFLDKFFEDLRFEVADQLGEGIDRRKARAEATRLVKIGFRDRNGVKTGDEWMRKIETAIRNAKVLVCVYSANFFSPGRIQHFCGHEFEAFLQRLQVKYRRLSPTEFELEGVRNILPVIWVKERLLLKGGRLPPSALRPIQWALDEELVKPEVNAEYLEMGMEHITRQRKDAYFEIVEYLAERIVDFDALEPARTRIDITQLRNAFWDPPPPDPDGTPPNPGPDSMPPDPDPEGTPPKGGPGGKTAPPSTASLHGPRELLVIEASTIPSDTSWLPYSNQCSVDALITEVASVRELGGMVVRLDPRAEDFSHIMSALLEDATARNVRPIIIADPRCFAENAWLTALTAPLRRAWYVGFVVPVDKTDAELASVVEQVRQDLEPAPDVRDWVVTRISIGTIEQFRTAVISVADEILSRMTAHAPVPRPHPNSDGPDTRPRIANTHDQARAN